MGILDKLRGGGERTFQLKGYSGYNRWVKVGEFDKPVNFDEAVEEVDDPTQYKRFKLMEYRGGTYKRTVWKENNPDYVPKEKDAAKMGEEEMKKYVRSQIETASGELATVYEKRFEAGMDILTKATTSAMEILTEAMKTAAKVEVESLKAKIDHAKEVAKLVSPPDQSASGGKKEGEGSFMDELSGAIKGGITGAIKEGVKERAKKRDISVPEK